MFTSSGGSLLFALVPRSVGHLGGWFLWKSDLASGTGAIYRLFGGPEGIGSKKKICWKKKVCFSLP